MTLDLFARQRRTARRIVLLCACAAPFGWAMFFAVFHNVPGQDWVVFHTAARLARTGDLHTLADPRAFTDLMNWTHRAWFTHPITVLHPWVYPPVTLLLALAFGWLSYPVSLAAFLAVTLGLLVAALWRWQTGPARWALIASVIASPACAYTIGSGQLSFLIAAAVLTGVLLLPAEPFLAGVAFSLLCLKPQFVPLIPVALLAGRQWRAIAGGLVGGVFLVVASLLIVGWRNWVAWIAFAAGRDKLLGSMIAVVRVYDQSVHTCLRILGAPEWQAGLGQLAATAAAALCVWLVFARPASARLRLIVLMCALVFGAPHVGDYDEVMPVIAATLTVLDCGSRLWRRGEAELSAAIWLATMLTPPALIAVLQLPLLTILSALTPAAVGALMIVAALPTAAAGDLRDDLGHFPVDV